MGVLQFCDSGPLRVKSDTMSTPKKAYCLVTYPSSTEEPSCVFKYENTPEDTIDDNTLLDLSYNVILLN